MNLRHRKQEASSKKYASILLTHSILDAHKESKYEAAIPKIVAIAPEFMQTKFEEILREGIKEKSVSDEMKIHNTTLLAKLTFAFQGIIKWVTENQESFQSELEEARRFAADEQAALESEEKFEVTQDGNEVDDTPGFVAHLLKTVGLATLSNALPLSALALPLVADALPTQLFAGTPPASSGLSSLCQNKSDCIEGYLASPGNVSSILSQLGRWVNTTLASNSVENSAFINCMSLDKIAPYIEALYQNANATLSGNLSCTTEQFAYRESFSQIGVTDLPASSCSGFLQQMTADVFNHCANIGQSITQTTVQAIGQTTGPTHPVVDATDWAIVGGAVGGTVLLMALCTFCCACRPQLR